MAPTVHPRSIHPTLVQKPQLPRPVAEPKGSLHHTLLSTALPSHPTTTLAPSFPSTVFRFPRTTVDVLVLVPALHRLAVCPPPPIRLSKRPFPHSPIRVQPSLLPFFPDAASSSLFLRSHSRSLILRHVYTGSHILRLVYTGRLIFPCLGCPSDVISIGLCPSAQSYMHNRTLHSSAGCHRHEE